MTAISLYFDKLRFSTSCSLFLNILLKNFPSHLQGEEKRSYWNRIQEAPTGVCILFVRMLISSRYKIGCKLNNCESVEPLVLSSPPSPPAWLNAFLASFFESSSRALFLVQFSTTSPSSAEAAISNFFQPPPPACACGHHITCDPEVTKIEYA